MNHVPNIMMKTLALLSCAIATACSAQNATLTLPAQRISDSAIAADHAAYEHLQGRIHALNEAGRKVRDYHLSKAQCWLDVSLHEYTRNDRSPFPQEAMSEANQLIVAMEQNITPLPMDTPLVNHAARLRPDLWDQLAGFKSEAGLRCGGQQVACAEVELVHAGNEHNQQQWRHAKPYVQIAEELTADAFALIGQCAPARAMAPLVPAPLVPAPPLAPLGMGVVFDFDRAQAEHVRPFSVAQLEQVLQQIKKEQWRVRSVQLTGHADRLNGSGAGDYNRRLAERRVATVRAMLIGRGIDATLISTSAVGDRQQIAACGGHFKSTAELEECLLPNRRVDVLLVLAH